MTKVEVGTVAKGQVVELSLNDRGRIETFKLTIVKKKKYTVDVKSEGGTIWNLDNDIPVKLI